MNFEGLERELLAIKQKQRKEEEKLLHEVNRILTNDLYTGKNVLNNLKNYQKLEELVEEDFVEAELVFKLSEIKELALLYRLKFLDSQCYKHEFPPEVVMKVEEFNEANKKNLKGYKILGTDQFFNNKSKDHAMLFAPTDLGNYCLITSWGVPLKKSRKWVNWPLRNIENLFISLLIFTLIVTLLLPTNLITLDRKATYWCGYRIGVFFHLFIFFMGFTVYWAFAFSRNLSSQYWNRKSNFG